MDAFLYHIGWKKINKFTFCNDLCTTDNESVKNKLFDQYRYLDHHDQGEIFIYLPLIMKRLCKIKHPYANEIDTNHVKQLLELWIGLVDCGFNPLKSYTVHSVDIHSFSLYHNCGNDDDTDSTLILSTKRNKESVLCTVWPFSRIINYDSDVENDLLYKLVTKIFSQSTDIENDILFFDNKYKNDDENKNIKETKDINNTLFGKLFYNPESKIADRNTKLRVNCLHALVDFMELHIDDDRCNVKQYVQTTFDLDNYINRDSAYKITERLYNLRK